MLARRSAPLILALLAVASTGCGYNRIVGEEQQVESAWSQVENQMQRRFELIPNLVEVVKAYDQHEKAVFEQISNARAAMAGAGSRGAKIDASNQLDSAVSRLLVVVESYPQLKANENFQRLMDELAGTENRLAVERKRYNDAVQLYNQDVRGIPGAWWAKIGGFPDHKDYFKSDVGAKAAPKVSFQ